jgi:hypothetical protein
MLPVRLARTTLLAGCIFRNVDWSGLKASLGGISLTRFLPAICVQGRAAAVAEACWRIQLANGEVKLSWTGTRMRQGVPDE